MDQKTGTAAILAFLAAAGSWVADFTGHPIVGIFLSLASIPLGIMGLVLAVSPRVSGGILSIFSIILGVGGFIFSILIFAGMILL